MQVQEDTPDVGVIVGRFQVPELHTAHLDLIDTVCDRHDKVLILLGASPVPATRENPLDFESRKQMLLDAFPGITVVYIVDMPSDEAWSRRLDKMVGEFLTPSQSAMLYGSRDSFIARYSGKLPTAVLESTSFISGSQIRREVSRKSVRGTADFRAGAVWAAFNRFPTCYPTVDIAIFDEDTDRILLGRKENEPLYRLVGGFADPGSETYEQDARREVHEEAGIEITDPVYVGSFKIDDWRYRGEVDTIKTLLFVAHYQFGSPKAADDLAEVRWFDVADLSSDDLLDVRRDVMPNHRPLLAAALAHFDYPVDYQTEERT